MHIRTRLMKGKDLNPGALFSSEGDSYWQHRNPKSIGEKVYIRTDTPLTPTQEDEEVYLITIITEPEVPASL